MQSSIQKVRPLDRFFRLLRADRKDVAQIYWFALFDGLIYLSIPLGIQSIINFIQAGQVSASWVLLLIIVLVGIALTGIIQVVKLRITENIQQKIFARASFEFAYRITRLRTGALRNKYAPELMNRLFDIVVLQKGLSKILLDFSSALLQILFGLILLALYHPVFILFGIGLFSLLYLLMWTTARKGFRTSLNESNHKYELVYWLEEVARAMNDFKMSGNTRLPLEKTNQHVDAYTDARESHFHVLKWQYSLLVAFKVLVAAGLLIIGGLLVFEEQLSIGQFVAAEIVILTVISSVEKIVFGLDNVYDVLTSLEKIAQVTDLPVEEPSSENAFSFNAQKPISLEIKDLSWNADKTRLKELNFSVAGGERLLITGENGSGKSVLIQILSTFWMQDKGEVMYHGHLLSQWNKEDFSERVNALTAEDIIFNGSLYHNITMGRVGVEKTQVNEALHLCGLTSFVSQLPNGLDTIIVKAGAEFPDSIREKIILARSVVNKPSLLLLDEPLLHVHPKERKEIIHRLCSSEQTWTLVVASNRIEWMEECDHALLLKEDAACLPITSSYVHEIKPFVYA